MKYLLSVLVLVIPTLAPAQETRNPLFDELVGTGVPLPEGPAVKLPAPLLKPGQPAPGDSSAVLEKAAGRVPVELFLRRSATAPFSLTIESVEKPDGTRCGQVVNLTFVAYARLEAVSQTDFMKQLLGGKGKPDGGNVELGPEELKQRHIPSLDTPKSKEHFGTLGLSLLDKVRVEGVTRTLRTTLPHAIVYAVKLDDRFKNDKEYPNRWRAIVRNGDEDRLGPPQPYTGLAGYVLVTELPEPKDGLLIEMHFLLHEPPDWFGGRNLLRSKLPILIQDNVRSFRRKLVRD